MALLLAALLAQDSARDLVERLGSDKVEERQEAERKLVALGRAAAPELEKAAKAADQEVAGRARFLLRILDIRDQLTPGLKEAFPGIEERLAGGDAAYTAAFFAAAEKKVKARDLEALAAPAARGAVRTEDKERFCGIASELRLRSAAPEIARYLKDPDQGLRGSAALCLGNIGARDFAAALLPILSEPDDGTRHCALNSLEQLRARSLVPDFEALLEHPDAGVRADAVRILTTLYARGSLPRVIKLFQDPEADVRHYAVEAMFYLDQAPAIDILLPLLEDVKPEIRANALDLLAGRGAKLPLGRLLRDSSPRVRSAAVSAAARSRTLDALPDLVPLLKEDELRRQVIGAFQEFGLEEAVPALIPLLKGKEAAERASVVWALREIRGAAAIDGLILALEDVDPVLRRTAVDALAHLDARRSLPALGRRLKDPDPRVRQAAFGAIRSIGSPSAWKDLAALLENEALEVRRPAAQALGAIGAVDAIPSLLKALGHPEPMTRLFAAEALWNIRPSEGDAAYAKLLRDREESVRLSAARELAFALHPALLASLEDEDPDVRRTSVSALPRARPSEAVPLLRKRLDDPEARVKDVAARALEEIRKDGAEPEFDEPPRVEEPAVKESAEERNTAIATWLEILEAEDVEARSGAVKSLARLGAKEHVLRVLREDGPLRGVAVRTLPALLGREALPALRGLLDDLDAGVRVQAVEGFVKLGSAIDIPRLLPLLDDEVDYVRVAAIEALGLLGAKEAAPRLALFLEGYRPQTREVAIKALAALDAGEAAPAMGRLLNEHGAEGFKALTAVRGRAAAGQILRYLESGASSFRQDAAETLGLLDARETIPDLLELLKPRRSRTGAAQALGELVAREAAPALLPLLGDEDGETRAAAAIAIGRLASADAVPALLRLFEGGTARDRREALRALGALKAAEAVPFLLRLSAGGQEELALESLDALASIGGKANAAAIRRLTRSPSSTIRFGAVDALGRMGEITGTAEDLELLGDPGGTAGEWLCRAGVRKAAVHLFAPRGGFSELNALRQPEAWKRLESLNIEGLWTGSVKEILERLAARAGMSIDLPDHFGLVNRAVVRDGTSVLRALREHPLHELELILEPGRIRFVPVADAARLWDEWKREIFRKKK